MYEMRKIRKVVFEGITRETRVILESMSNGFCALYFDEISLNLWHVIYDYLISLLNLLCILPPTPMISTLNLYALINLGVLDITIRTILVDQFRDSCQDRVIFSEGFVRLINMTEIMNKHSAKFEEY